MEKYFVAQLDELHKRRSRGKLIEVTFSRRPSTFGVLYATRRQTGGGSSWESWLKLATLSLTPDNKAKFMIVREINLNDQVDNKSSSHKAQRPSPIVDFDTLPSGRLLIEGAGATSSAEQLLSSSVFLLTCDGHLLVASMISRSLRQVPRCHAKSSDGPASKAARETFVQIKTAAERCVDQASRQPQVDLFVLSSSTLYLYSLELRDATNPEDSNLELTSKYSLAGQADKPTSDDNVQFVRMLPLAPGPSGPVVLLELSDGCVQVVQRDQCLARVPELCRNVARSLLLLAPSTADSSQLEPDFLISATNSNEIVANSLVVRRDSTTKAKSSNPSADTQDEHEMELFGQIPFAAGARNENDPDGLLPEEPNFELEHCWTLKLNAFPGVQAMFDEEEDDEEVEGNAEQGPERRRRHAPALCLPIWPWSGASGELQRRPNGQPNAWPKFLIVFCQRHLLMFSFEKANALPFSLVYDRAFLNLTNPTATINDDNTSNGINKKQALEDERVDLRLKPRLLHSVKLMGTQTSDNLFNMLLLTSRIQFVEASNFNQLALLAAISDQGHVLAFKLTSKKLLGANYKDNLYQTLLVDSLRDPALLQDELHRIRQIENKLAMQSSKVESLLKCGVADSLDEADEYPTSDGTTKSNGLQQILQSAANSLQLTVKLEPNPSDVRGNLYELIIGWPSVMPTVNRVIVVAFVEGAQLRAASAAESSRSPVKTVKIKRILIEDSEQNKLQKIVQGETPTEPNSCNCATIELDNNEHDQLDSDVNRDESDLLDLSESISRQNKLIVSMSLVDFKVGTVKVVLVRGDPSHDQGFNNQFSIDEIFLRSQHHLDRGYIKKELPIRLLNSFRFIPLGEGSNETSGHSEDEKFSFSGALGFERALAWLGQLVDLPNDVMNLKRKERIPLEFRSSSGQGRIQVEIWENKITFSGNVSKVLDMIKQHILKRATDSSIKLELL